MIRYSLSISAVLILIASLATAAETEQSTEALEAKLCGVWDGYGPCDGYLTILSDHTYSRKLYGPAGIDCQGTWSIKWSALPPTIVFECTESDEPTHVGKKFSRHLVQLNDTSMTYKQMNETSRATHFTRQQPSD